jgi:hypothetical protein
VLQIQIHRDPNLFVDQEFEVSDPDPAEEPNLNVEKIRTKLNNFFFTITGTVPVPVS